MNNEILFDDKPSRDSLIAAFELQIAGIGFQFRENLTANDLTKGETRDALVHRLLVDLDHAQTLFLHKAHEAGLMRPVKPIRILMDSGRDFRSAEILGAAGAAGTGAALGSATLGTVLHTATTGFLIWKTTEVTTLAMAIAALGVSPVLLPAAAGLALGGVGWVGIGSMVRRRRLKSWRAHLTSELETGLAELRLWAGLVSCPEDTVVAAEAHS